MLITRRDWLALTAAVPLARSATQWIGRPPSLSKRLDRDGGDPTRRTEASTAREQRIGRVITSYERQGIHRTGTDVDRISADWLCEEVRQAGLTPALEPFPLNRVDPVTAVAITPERRIEGVPLFDAAFTGAAGIRGRLGAIDGDAPIGLTETAPNTAAAGALGDARRRNRHAAIVCVTRGGRPGLCPSNADLFLKPFGPPVLQVSSDDAPRLREWARLGAEVHVTVHARRTEVGALNVVATLAGADQSLSPLVVMTPRSGWWTCASERGGGIACWLELMRELKPAGLARDVVFVASSGHELGHLGINAFVDKRPGIVARSAGWMHLGANIGAAQEPGTTIQASDDEFEKLQSDAMGAAGLAITRRNPRGTVPGGEAEVVHLGGGRYVSVIGRNALFHNPADRGPEAFDATAIARFVDVFVRVARALAG